MGKVVRRDLRGNITTVDKTWVFKKGEDGVAPLLH
jgi:hypothetical protein